MSSMRGLVQFIADLRNARARELEEKRINKELANIRQKFKSEKLDGYQKKKYVCKLLYIYIQGYNVDFGHLEAVNLISNTKYSEKQVGYLAVTLFLHEQHDLLHLVVNSIRKDLLDHNELNNCLALHAVANVGGREMGEALSGDVHRLLISPTSKSFVKKKAALTLLRLYRKYPNIIQQEWAERIISIMDDPDIGVVLSVTSLVMALAQDYPDAYKGSYVKAAQRLRKVVESEGVSPDYLYYKVPCPWLQIKFLKLLQYFPPSEDTHVREIIRESLQQIMQLATEAPKNIQQSNAQNAVLFEAINLLIHLDSEHQLMMTISSKLGKFIQSRETNIRYLGLDAMTHFAARADTLDPIKRHQNIIIGSLRDRDVSVRRKGLDLLYSMCDTSNAQAIVGELLKYLQSADFSIREEMVLKIAILTEKYATDARWYIDISLRLLAMAGDHVSDEVWQRVIQIVTNNEELQSYAATTTLEYIKSETCHDTLVKIGGYILGEFGHLIADNEGSSPIEQYMALHGKMLSSSDTTRALLLSSFVKFVNLFPEIKPQLVKMFTTYSHSPDSELQQRACEYLALVSLPTDDLLRTVCDEMPPFSERASVLLARLHKKSHGTSERRTWLVGGKDANDEKKLQAQQTGGLKRSFTAIVNGSSTLTNGNSHGASAIPAQTTSSSRDLLAGLDMNGHTEEPKAMDMTSAVHLTPGWEAGFEELSTKSEGILFEDPQIQIGLRQEYKGNIGILKLYFTNRATFPVGSFTLTVDNKSNPSLKIDTKSLPESHVAAGSQAQATLFCYAHAPFSEPPTIRVSYLAGALQAYTLRLPVLSQKYMDPLELTAQAYFNAWRKIPDKEAQHTFSIPKGRALPDTFIHKTMERLGWMVLPGVEPNPMNTVGCAVFQSEKSKVGCLLRIEPNREQQGCRITVRVTQEGAAKVLMNILLEKLSPSVAADNA